MKNLISVRCRLMDLIKGRQARLEEAEAESIARYEALKALFPREKVRCTIKRKKKEKKLNQGEIRVWLI